jgi:hypothetical protein
MQLAYKNGHNTESLTKIHNELVDYLDKNKDVTIVFLDLSAALDTLDHNIFNIHPNNTIGISDTAFSWFVIYFAVSHY